MKKTIKAMLALGVLALTLSMVSLTAHASGQTSNEDDLTEIQVIFENDKKLVGAKDAQGKILVEALYTSIRKSSFRDEYFDVTTADKSHGLLDQYGRWVIGLQKGVIEAVDFVNETYILRTSTEFSWYETKLMSFSGQDVTPQGYREALSVANGFVVGINTPVLTKKVSYTLSGTDYDFTAIEKALLTPGGLKFDMKYDDAAYALSSEKENDVYRNFVWLTSKDANEQKLIHSTKGNLGSYYRYTGLVCSDKPEEQYVFAFYNEDGVYDKTQLSEIEYDLIVDIYNAHGDLIYDGIGYAVAKKTSNGFKLSNEINAPQEETRYFWANGSQVKAGDLDKFLNTERYEGFDGDTNNRSAFDYYPTAGGSNIDFSLDKDLMAILNNAIYASDANANHNMIWYGEENSPANTPALITFNDDKTVHIKLTAYNKYIRLFMEDALNYTFDRKIIYNVLDQISNDLEGVYFDGRYQTSKLTTQTIDLGPVDLTYKDGDSSIDMMISYDKDLRAKGLAAFDKHVESIAFPQVDVEFGSLNSVLHYAYSSQEMEEYGKSGIEVLKEYLEKKYTVALEASPSRPHDITIFNGKVNFYNEGNLEVRFDFDYGSHAIEFMTYSDASEAFLKYLMDGLYTETIAKPAYTHLLSEIDQLIYDHPGQTLRSLLSKVGNKVVEVGAMALDYDETIGITWTYPIYDHQNYRLYNRLDHSNSMYNLGYQAPKSKTSLFNYFKPYGYVIDAYVGFDGHVILGNSSLIYNKQSRHGSFNDLVIDKSSGNNISIRISNENLYSSQNYDQLEFLQDYLLLAFGQEKGKGIIDIIEEGFKPNEKGFRKAIDGLEKTFEGIKVTGHIDSQEKIYITFPDTTWDESEEESLEFSDINYTRWYYTDVKRLVDKGAISGYPDGTFGPDKSITVGEFIKTTISTVEDGVFHKDSKGLHWANGMLEYAIEKGIVNDHELTVDDLDRPINRYEMARILIRISENILNEQASDTSKVSTIMSDYKTLAEPYKYYVEQAYAKGILGGVDTSGTYGGQALGSRAEASTMIVRIIDASRRITVDYD